MAETAPYNASLHAFDLAVARGGVMIVDGVNLTLAPGEAIILRGPNGAGKTTLLRALAGLLPPAAGGVSVAGAEESRIFCGALSGAKAALTVNENLKFWTALYGAPTTRIAEARKRLGLDRYAERPAGHLSTGYGRRLGLARLVIAARPLWLVDEPTAALDAAASEVFESLLAEHRVKGGAAMIATHEPLEAPGARVMELAA